MKRFWVICTGLLLASGIAAVHADPGSPVRLGPPQPVGPVTPGLFHDPGSVTLDAPPPGTWAPAGWRSDPNFTPASFRPPGISGNVSPFKRIKGNEVPAPTPPELFTGQVEQLPHAPRELPPTPMDSSAIAL